MDIGQALLTALVEVAQQLVVEAHEVKDSGVDIVQVDPVGNGLEAEIISLSIIDTSSAGLSGSLGTATRFSHARVTFVKTTSASSE